MLRCSFDMSLFTRFDSVYQHHRDDSELCMVTLLSSKTKSLLGTHPCRGFTGMIYAWFNTLLCCLIWHTNVVNTKILWLQSFCSYNLETASYDDVWMSLSNPIRKLSFDGEHVCGGPTSNTVECWKGKQWLLLCWVIASRMLLSLS